MRCALIDLNDTVYSAENLTAPQITQFQCLTECSRKAQHIKGNCSLPHANLGIRQVEQTNCNIAIGQEFCQNRCCLLYTSQLRNEADRDIKERRSEISRQERRIQQKEESLDRKLENAEKKEEQIQQKLASAEEKLAEADTIKKSQLDQLERISGLTVSQAKEQLLESLEGELVHEKALKIASYEPVSYTHLCRCTPYRSPSCIRRPAGTGWCQSDCTLVY